MNLLSTFMKDWFSAKPKVARAPMINESVGDPAQEFKYRVDLDRGSTVLEQIFQQEPQDPNKKMNFLDLGGRDGKLKILLGTKDGRFDKARHGANRRAFYKKFEYTGSDLQPSSDRVLVGDLCRDDYLDENSHFVDFFDVIYSNNVFEHLARPWVTVRHIDRMLRAGGLCAIVVPFSQRYHKSPVDHFRYTHTGIESLFKSEAKGEYYCLATGYDIYQRRMNVFGRNDNALVPDELGGWRETWYTVTLLRKKI